MSDFLLKAVIVSFWLMAASSLFTTIMICIKTKWWKSGVGRNLFWLSFFLTIDSFLVVLVRNNAFSLETRLWIGVVIYAGTGIGVLWLGLNVWNDSKTWAWKRKRSK